MITWGLVRPGDGRTEIVEIYDDLAAALDAVAATSWEDPGNAWVSYLSDEEGQAVAVAIFGPDMELFVTCADGRRLVFSMPDSYREAP